MERKNYFVDYYDKHKDVLNERRLFDYYTKKFNKKFVDKFKAEHGNEALDKLKIHSRNTIKINKLEKRKQDLQKELEQLSKL